jgi:hypothetical protein
VGGKNVKAKIICILVTTLLITTTLPAVGKMTSNNCLIETGQKTEPNSQYLLKPTQSLAGLKVAVINAGVAPDQVTLTLDSWGASADLIDVTSISFANLKSYNNIWVPVQASMDIDSAGKATDIQNLVNAGAGLIFCQPNPHTVPYTPACLPYTWEIIDLTYLEPCAETIVDPTHDLTVGLIIDDMPDAGDTMGTIAAEYTILALSEGGEPSFACAEYGKGKIVMTMDGELGPWTDICGDNPPMSQAMVLRMLDWSKKPKSADIPLVETINRPLLQILQSHPNLFPLLQKIIHQLGL